MRIFISLCLMATLTACGKASVNEQSNSNEYRVIIGKLLSVDTDYTSINLKDSYGDDIESCGNSVASFEVFTKAAKPVTTVKLKQKLDEHCENSFYDTAYYTRYQLLFFRGAPDADGAIEVSNAYVDDRNPFFLFNIYQINGQLYADVSDENIYIDLRDESDDVINEDRVFIDKRIASILSLNELLTNHQLDDDVADLSTPANAGIWSAEIYSPSTFEQVYNADFRSVDAEDGKTIYLNRALILNTAYPEIATYMLANENVPKQ